MVLFFFCGLFFRPAGRKNNPQAVKIRLANNRRHSLEAKLAELKTRLLEINDLESAAALLSWDQTTYMPPGGALARGRQMATLGQLAHEKFTDPAVGRLLDDLQ